MANDLLEQTMNDFLGGGQQQEQQQPKQETVKEPVAETHDTAQKAAAQEENTSNIGAADTDLLGATVKDFLPSESTVQTEPVENGPVQSVLKDTDSAVVTYSPKGKYDNTSDDITKWDDATIDSKVGERFAAIRDDVQKRYNSGEITDFDEANRIYRETMQNDPEVKRYYDEKDRRYYKKYQDMVDTGRAPSGYDYTKDTDIENLGKKLESLSKDYEQKKAKVESGDYTKEDYDAYMNSWAEANVANGRYEKLYAEETERLKASGNSAKARTSYATIKHSVAVPTEGDIAAARGMSVKQLKDLIDDRNGSNSNVPASMKNAAIREYNSRVPEINRVQKSSEWLTGEKVTKAVSTNSGRKTYDETVSKAKSMTTAQIADALEHCKNLTDDPNTGDTANAKAAAYQAEYAARMEGGHAKSIGTNMYEFYRKGGIEDKDLNRSEYNEIISQYGTLEGYHRHNKDVYNFIKEFYNDPVLEKDKGVRYYATTYGRQIEDKFFEILNAQREQAEYENAQIRKTIPSVTPGADFSKAYISTVNTFKAEDYAKALEAAIGSFGKSRWEALVATQATAHSKDMSTMNDIMLASINGDIQKKLAEQYKIEGNTEYAVARLLSEPFAMNLVYAAASLQAGNNNSIQQVRNAIERYDAPGWLSGAVSAGVFAQDNIPTLIGGIAAKPVQMMANTGVKYMTKRVVAKEIAEGTPKLLAEQLGRTYMANFSNNIWLKMATGSLGGTISVNTLIGLQNVAKNLSMYGSWYDPTGQTSIVDNRMLMLGAVGGVFSPFISKATAGWSGVLGKAGRFTVSTVAGAAPFIVSDVMEGRSFSDAVQTNLAMCGVSHMAGLATKAVEIKGNDEFSTEITKKATRHIADTGKYPDLAEMMQDPVKKMKQVLEDAKAKGYKSLEETPLGKQFEQFCEEYNKGKSGISMAEVNQVFYMMTGQKMFKPSALSAKVVSKGGKYTVELRDQSGHFYDDNSIHDTREEAIKKADEINQKNMAINISESEGLYDGKVAGDIMNRTAREMCEEEAKRLGIDTRKVKEGDKNYDAPTQRDVMSKYDYLTRLTEMKKAIEASISKGEGNKEELEKVLKEISLTAEEQEFLDKFNAKLDKYYGKKGGKDSLTTDKIKERLKAEGKDIDAIIAKKPSKRTKEESKALEDYYSMLRKQVEYDSETFGTHNDRQDILDGIAEANRARKKAEEAEKVKMEHPEGTGKKESAGVTGMYQKPAQKFSEEVYAGRISADMVSKIYESLKSRKEKGQKLTADEEKTLSMMEDYNERFKTEEDIASERNREEAEKAKNEVAAATSEKDKDTGSPEPANEDTEGEAKAAGGKGKEETNPPAPSPEPAPEPEPAAPSETAPKAQGGTESPKAEEEKTEEKKASPAPSEEPATGIIEITGPTGEDGGFVEGDTFTNPGDTSIYRVTKASEGEPVDVVNATTGEQVLKDGKKVEKQGEGASARKAQNAGIEDVISTMGVGEEEASMMRSNPKAYSTAIKNAEKERQQAHAYAEGKAEKPRNWEYWADRDGLYEPKTVSDEKTLTGKPLPLDELAYDSEDKFNVIARDKGVKEAVDWARSKVENLRQAKATMEGRISKEKDADRVFAMNQEVSSIEKEIDGLNGIIEKYRTKAIDTPAEEIVSGGEKSVDSALQELTEQQKNAEGEEKSSIIAKKKEIISKFVAGIKNVFSGSFTVDGSHEETSAALDEKSRSQYEGAISNGYLIPAMYDPKTGNIRIVSEDVRNAGDITSNIEHESIHKWSAEADGFSWNERIQSEFTADEMKKALYEITGHHGYDERSARTLADELIAHGGTALMRGEKLSENENINKLIKEAYADYRSYDGKRTSHDGGDTGEETGKTEQVDEGAPGNNDVPGNDGNAGRGSGKPAEVENEEKGKEAPSKDVKEGEGAEPGQMELPFDWDSLGIKFSLKKGQLTDEEWEKIKQDPVYQKKIRDTRAEVDKQLEAMRRESGEQSQSTPNSGDLRDIPTSRSGLSSKNEAWHQGAVPSAKIDNKFYSAKILSENCGDFLNRIIVNDLSLNYNDFQKLLIEQLGVESHGGSSDYIDINMDNGLSLRISNHTINPERIKSSGRNYNKANYSVVIWKGDFSPISDKNNGRDLKQKDYANANQYVYDYPSRERLIGIAKSLFHLFGTGEYVDLADANKYGRIPGIEEGESVESTLEAKPIPHDKRMNPKKALQYLKYVSKGNIEKAAEMVKAAAKRAMPNTKVVDADGNPLIVFHGSPYGDIEVFDHTKGSSSGLKEYGTYFTTNRLVAELYMNGRKLTPELEEKINKNIAEIEEKMGNVRNGREHYELQQEKEILEKAKEGKIYACYLNIEHPKVFDAKGKDGYEGWNELTQDVGYDIKRGTEAKEAITGHNPAARMPEKYDGIIAKNMADIHSGGDVSKYIGDVYLVWDPKQIKSADPVTYDKKGNVIPLNERFNNEKDELKFSLVKGDSQTRADIDIANDVEKHTDKAGRTLYGSHNISRDKLIKALRLGSLVNPSTAVTKVTEPHTDYGDISLLMPPELVDKKSGRNNGTYSGDAYTPVMPRISYFGRMKSVDNARKYIDSFDIPKEVKDELGSMQQYYLTQGGENGATGLEFPYLIERGVNKDEILKHTHEGMTPLFEDVCNKYKTADEFKKAYESDEKLREQFATHSTSKKLDELLPRNEGESYHQYRLRRKAFLTYDKYKELKEQGFYDAPSTEEAIAEYEKQMAQYKSSEKIDGYSSAVSAKRYIEHNNLDADFEDWLDDKETGFGAKAQVFDGYTKSGERKYVDATAENLSKLINRDAKENGETGTGWAGFGSFMAKNLNKMGTIKEIKALENVLGSKEDKSEFREKWIDVYNKLRDQLGDFRYADKHMMELVGKKDIKKYAKDNFVVDIDDNFVNEFKELQNAIKNESKTHYFETKFGRPVGFSEFSDAVVPLDTPTLITDALEDYGVKIHRYNPDVEGDREAVTKDAVNKGEIAFSLTVGSSRRAEALKRLSPEYDKAVEAGDEKKAGEILKQYAKVAMPDTKIKNANGDLVQMYHGTFLKEYYVNNRTGDVEYYGDEPFYVFNTNSRKELGAHFGNKAQAENSAYMKGNGYAHEGVIGKEHIYKVYLNVKNPIELDDAEEWTFENLGEQLIKEGYITNSEYSDLSSSNTPDYDMKKLLISKGYDGVLYYNKYEGNGISVIVFSPEQIKSADPITYDDNGNPIPLEERLDEGKDDIRFSMTVDRSHATGDKMHAAKVKKENEELHKYASENIESVRESAQKAKGELENLNAEMEALNREAEELNGKISENLSKWSAMAEGSDRDDIARERRALVDDFSAKQDEVRKKKYEIDAKRIELLEHQATARNMQAIIDYTEGQQRERARGGRGAVYEAAREWDGQGIDEERANIEIKKALLAAQKFLNGREESDLSKEEKAKYDALIGEVVAARIRLRQLQTTPPVKPQEPADDATQEEWDNYEEDYENWQQEYSNWKYEQNILEKQLIDAAQGTYLEKARQEFIDNWNADNEDAMKNLSGVMGVDMYTRQGVGHTIKQFIIDRRKAIATRNFEDMQMKRHIQTELEKYLLGNGKAGNFILKTALASPVARIKGIKELNMELIGMVEGTSETPEALKPLVQDIRNYLDDVHNFLVSEGLANPYQYRQSYLPHIWDMSKSNPDADVLFQLGRLGNGILGIENLKDMTTEQVGQKIDEMNENLEKLKEARRIPSEALAKLIEERNSKAHKPKKLKKGESYTPEEEENNRIWKSYQEKESELARERNKAREAVDTEWKRINLLKKYYDARQRGLTQITDAFETPEKDETTQWSSTKSRFMNERTIESYKFGMEHGLVPKYDNVGDMVVEYGHRANEAVGNRNLINMLRLLKFDGKPVLKEYSTSPDPDYTTSKDLALKGYQILSSAAPYVNVVFGELKSPDHKEFTHKMASFYDAVSGLAKSIALTASGFHAIALTEGSLGTQRLSLLGATWNVVSRIGLQTMFTGKLPTTRNPELVADALEHMVKLGGSGDYNAKEVVDQFEQFANWFGNWGNKSWRAFIEAKNSKEANEAFSKGAMTKAAAKGILLKVAGTPGRAAANVVGGLTRFNNWILWNLIHDSMKMYAYKTLSYDVRKNAKKKGWDEATTNRTLDEIGQFINDTFGGQNWDTIMISQKKKKWSQRVMLSPDWNLSVLRHMGSLFGASDLYNRNSFMKQVGITAGQMYSSMVSDNEEISKNPSSDYKKKKAWSCIFTSMITSAAIWSAVNLLNRKKDMEAQRELVKNGEITKSPYEVREVKDYDLSTGQGLLDAATRWREWVLVPGVNTLNVNGKQSYLFLWTDKDGIERYMRWGKQYREIPDLIFNSNGEASCWEWLSKIWGKKNPMMNMFEDVIVGGNMVSLFKNKEIFDAPTETEGNVARLRALLKEFTPFSMRDGYDEEVSWVNFMMPVTTGVSSTYKAKQLYKLAFLADGGVPGDNVKRINRQLVQNGYDPTQIADAVKKALDQQAAQEFKQSMQTGEDCMKAFDEAKAELQKAKKEYSEAKDSNTRNAAQKKVNDARQKETWAKNNMARFTGRTSVDDINIIDQEAADILNGVDGDFKEEQTYYDNETSKDAFLEIEVNNKQSALKIYKDRYDDVNSKYKNGEITEKEGQKILTPIADKIRQWKAIEDVKKKIKTTKSDMTKTAKGDTKKGNKSYVTVEEGMKQIRTWRIQVLNYMGLKGEDINDDSHKKEK